MASVESKGASYGTALLESFNGLDIRELIYRRDPQTRLADVEFATLAYVDRFQQRAPPRQELVRAGFSGGHRVWNDESHDKGSHTRKTDHPSVYRG